MFNMLSIFFVIELRGPVAIVTFDTNRLIVYFPPYRQGPLVVRVFFVFAARAVTRFALHPSQPGGNLLADETLCFAITCCVTLEAIGIVFHPPQPGKSVRVGIFFPFLEVLKMTQTAFSIPNVIGCIVGKNKGGAAEKPTGGERNRRADEHQHGDTDCE